MAADKPDFDFKKMDDDDDAVFAQRMARYDHMDYGDDKLSREAYVIGGGTVDAVAKAFTGKNLVETGAETLGAAAVGLAVRAAEAKMPALRPAIAVAGLAMSFSVVRDLVHHGTEIGNILTDTWDHKDHQEQNRKAFAEHGGKFGLDLALTTGGAMLGSAVGNRVLFGPGSNYVRVPTYDGPGLFGRGVSPHERLFSKDDPLVQLLEKARPSILELHASALKGSMRSRANAFLIDDGSLAVTNCHCVNGKKDIYVTDYLGQKRGVDVLLQDAPRDIAILRVRPGSAAAAEPASSVKAVLPFEPLKLAEANAEPRDRLLVVSSQSKQRDLTLSPGHMVDMKTFALSPKMSFSEYGGKLKNTNTITVNPFSREVVYKKEPNWAGLVDAQRMLSTYYSKGGVSGSPVLSLSGEVVGIHTGNFGPKWSQITGRNASSPVSAIAAVLAAARTHLDGG
ncbi:MAG: trypsin-like peptidase domain-containing protein [Cyanobacteria bacterium REEB67]|nr:trypsin-like peptidase domain-containing protein [Cyanobacteria bacterium REEB67]